MTLTKEQAKKQYEYLLQKEREFRAAASDAAIKAEKLFFEHALYEPIENLAQYAGKMLSVELVYQEENSAEFKIYYLVVNLKYEYNMLFHWDWNDSGILWSKNKQTYILTQNETDTPIKLLGYFDLSLWEDDDD